MADSRWRIQDGGCQNKEVLGNDTKMKKIYAAKSLTCHFETDRSSCNSSVLYYIYIFGEVMVKMCSANKVNFMN